MPIIQEQPVIGDLGAVGALPLVQDAGLVQNVVVEQATIQQPAMDVNANLLLNDIAPLADDHFVVNDIVTPTLADQQLGATIAPIAPIKNIADIGDLNINLSVVPMAPETPTIQFDQPNIVVNKTPTVDFAMPDINNTVPVTPGTPDTPDLNIDLTGTLAPKMDMTVAPKIDMTVAPKIDTMGTIDTKMATIKSADELMAPKTDDVINVDQLIADKAQVDMKM